MKITINDELVEGSSDDFNEKERKARNKQKLLDYVKLNNLMGTIPSQDYQNIVALYESTGKLVIPDTSRIRSTYYTPNFEAVDKLLYGDRKKENNQLSYRIDNGSIEVYQGTKLLGWADNWEYVKGIYPELYEQHQYDLMKQCLYEECDNYELNLYYFYEWLGNKAFTIDRIKMKIYCKGKEIKTLEELINKIDSLW